MRPLSVLAGLSPVILAIASCGSTSSGETRQETGSAGRLPFVMQEIARFDEPWAMAFDPGTGVLFVTEKKGRIKFLQPGGRVGFVSGVPEVAYGGQGGLGDFVFAPGPPRPTLDERVVYLSWAEPGSGNTRGAAVARARMVCADHDSCELRDLRVIWRQVPKTTGFGHYSHRIAFSPDGRYLFISSGERQKFSPAQAMGTNLGKSVRLLPDGTPAPGNPFAARGDIARQFWTIGHRNILGLNFDEAGRLWALEHGPKGGDELNLIEPGRNYGWPIVSDGDHYGGAPIPRHRTRPEFAAPVISWNPVIAPGGMIIYRGSLFPEWRGQFIIAAMKPAAIVRVAVDRGRGRELARYPMQQRVRAIAEHRDGSIWLLEDGEDARLLRLSPRQR